MLLFTQNAVNYNVNISVVKKQYGTIVVVKAIHLKLSNIKEMLLLQQEAIISDDSNVANGFLVILLICIKHSIVSQ